MIPEMRKILSRAARYGIILLLIPVYGIYSQQKETAAGDTASTATDTLSAAHPVDSTADDTSATSSSVTKDTVGYEADIIEYDIKNKIILMLGNGIVRYHKMTLYADTIHFLFNDDMLVATGTPQLIEGNDTVVGENMVYNLKTGRGKVRYGTAHSEDSRYDGNEIAKSDERTYYIEDGAYTSCALEDSSHYCFYGKHIKVIPQDKAISRPIVLNIADAPVMALPYFITPLERGRQSGWLNPRWGGNPTNGGYLDNIGYYFAPNDFTDYRVSGRVYEFTDYVLEARANYNLKYRFNGSVTGRYSITEDRDTLNNLWALDYRHDQNILPDESMKLAGYGNIVSGKSFYKSLSEDTAELLQQQLNANMSLTKNFSKINAYSSIQWNRTHNFKTDIVDQNLPSFSFNLNTRPLIPKKTEGPAAPGSDNKDDEKWYNKIFYSYGINGNRKYSYNAEAEKEQRPFDHSGIGQIFSMSAPLKLLKWFDVSPNFNFQHSLFDAYVDTTKRQAFKDSIAYDTTGSYPTGKVADTIIDGTDTLYVYPIDTVTVSYFTHDTIGFSSPRYSFIKANTSYWNAGVSLSTKLYGLFPIKLFNFVGMRHTLTPSVSYTYYPKKDLDRTFPTVGVSYAGARERGQVLGLSFGNLFQGKVQTGRNDDKTKDKEQKNERTFTLLSANISTAYDFERKKKKWSDIGFSASIPNQFIDFSFGSTFTPYNESDALIVPRLLNYSIRLNPKVSGVGGFLWGGDFIVLNKLHTKEYMAGYKDFSNPGWNITINPSYSFSRSRLKITDPFITKREYHLGTSANIKFTNIWSASWSSQYDFTQNEFVNHSINFACDLECWDLKFDWYPSGFNQGAYYFIIRIKKHPEIKWTERESRLRY